MKLLENRHPAYQGVARRAEYVRLHQTGEVEDEAERQARTFDPATYRQSSLVDGSGKRFSLTGQRGSSPLGGLTGYYLVPRPQGESATEYRERAALSRFPRHLARLLFGFVGRLFQVEDKIERSGGEVLGERRDDGSLMARYWDDADGRGAQWLAQLRAAALDLCAHGHVWSAVLPAGGRAQVVRLRPEDVLNWRYEGGRLVEALVREEADVRPSLASGEAPRERFVHYTLAGWARYEKHKGSVRRLGGKEWQFPFWRTPKREDRRLPVERTQMPPALRKVGYRAAKGNNYLFNLLSDPRHILRISNHPKLAGDASPEQIEALKEQARKASNLYPGPWDYISPPPGNARVAYDIYKEETQSWYNENLQSYEDGAREATATEIRQQETGGAWSFLSFLATAVDEVENARLFLLEQIEAPRRPAAWRTARVERTTDFEPMDSEERGDRLARTFFGGNVEAEGQNAENVRREIYGSYGVEYEEQEAKSESEAPTRRERLEERIGRIRGDGAEGRPPEQEARESQG